jgi:hypothetical protein
MMLQDKAVLKGFFAFGQKTRRAHNHQTIHNILTEFLNQQESNMDFSPLVDAAATLASAVFAASAPIVLLKLNTMLKLNLDQTHRTAVATALDNALGIGLQVAQDAGDAHLSVVNVRSTALAAMVSYVKRTVPAAVSHFGLSDDSIAQKAAARLATALHISTVTATAVTTPAPAAVTRSRPDEGR